MTIAKKLRTPFLSGWIISWLGTLPFGVLNVLAFTIAGKESITEAVFFSFGVVISEVVIVALCIKWVGSFRLKPIVFEILQFAMAGFVLFLAIQQLLQIGTVSAQRTDLLSSDWPRFLLGLSLSAVNPSQFPFWIGWNALLKNNGILETRGKRIRYLSGIGTGTFCGLFCFITASQSISVSADFFGSTVYYLAMCGVFTITGGLMLFKCVQKRLVANRIKVMD